MLSDTHRAAMVTTFKTIAPWTAARRGRCSEKSSARPAFGREEAAGRAGRCGEDGRRFNVGLWDTPRGSSGVQAVCSHNLNCP